MNKSGARMNISNIKRRFCDNAPLSAQQKNIWLEHELHPENISYNIVSCLRLTGDLNVEAFKQSLDEIVQRHEVFRTTFSASESEPRQIIHPHTKASVSEMPLDVLSPEEQETEIQQAIHREVRLPFDLERGPLFRFVLFSLNRSEHVFLMTIHHLVMDGWSIRLFANELTKIYEAFCNNRPPPLSETSIQYSDYAIWQDEEYKKSHECDTGYWNNVIKDAVFGEFPGDYPRVFGRKGESATRTTTISADLTEKIKSFSREEHTTPFVTLMAGLQLVLHRYTGHENLLSGYYAAGRDQIEIKKLLGHFSNITIIRTEFSGDPDFREIVKRTRRSVFDTYAHGHLLVSNLSGYQTDDGNLNSTLFPVVFNYQNFPYPDWELHDLIIKPEAIDAGATRFDLEISIIPVEEELVVTVQYRKDLYAESTIDRILSHYKNILLAAMDNPDQPVHKLSIMSPAEIRQIIEDWNSEKAVYPTDATIHQLIDAAAREIPDSIALIFGNQEISYQQLMNLSNHIAHHLIEMGIRPEITVGVYMERSHNLLLALLAILKAGGVYVPLDPTYPDEKLTFMLRDSRAAILLTEKDKSTKFPGYDGKIIEMESLLSQISTDVIACDLPPVNMSSENSAYLIYTSGSTGIPKGVLVSHRNVVCCFCFMNIYIDDAYTTRTWLFSTSISFDPSVLEMFWTLSRGYKVIILPNESSGKFLDINSIPELIMKHHVSHFQGTPSVLSMLVDRPDGLAALKQLSKLMVGGESLPFTLAKKLSAELSIDVYNVYGPTEATIWATYYRLQKDDTSVPIGCPFPNYEIYILNKRLQPVPIGVYGELYIGGDGVSRGYFNDAELTASKYIPNHFSNRHGTRIYQTGDIARYKIDGTIEFLGRADRQVKVRGHRIELGEVEAAIMDCGGVREVVVTASGNTDTDRKLLGYVIPAFSLDNAEEPDLFIRSLKERLNIKLPEFMLPTSLTILKEFPKLSNGKIDRKSLPDLGMCAREESEKKSELSLTESALIKIWGEVLGAVDFDINDNYMAIGGNSLSAIIIINRIMSILNVKITIKVFFGNPTIKLLAKYIDRQIENAVSVPLDSVFSIARSDDMPLSFFQEARLRHEFQLDVGNVPYLHASTWFNIRLLGKLDRESLEKSFNYVVNRHEVFRTAYWPVVDTAVPGTDKWGSVCSLCRINPGRFLPKVKFKQSVYPFVKMNLDYYDVSEYDDENKDVEISVIAHDIIKKRYIYETPPLTRAALIRTAESEHILIVAAAHLVADAFSIRIYEKELAYAYNSMVNNQDIKLPDIKIQYADYAAWMKRRLETHSLDSMKSYWQKQLEGYTPTNVTILPFTDIEGSENDSDFSLDAKYYNHPVSVDLCGAIRKYASTFNVTPFCIAMTGYILYLYGESGKNDIGLLTFFSNRTQPETENIIGMFVTGNVIRVKIDPEDSYHQCTTSVSDRLTGALMNQEIVVPPSDSRIYKSLYDLIVYRPITCESWTESECVPYSGLDVEKVLFGRGKSEYALRLFVVDYGWNLSLLFEYNLDLFDGADIRKMAARIESLVKEIVINPSKIIFFNEDEL